ncbi:MAG: LpqB family beta-propeller domain-containing protein [Pseudomonadota bacterium]
MQRRKSTHRRAAQLLCATAIGLSFGLVACGGGGGGGGTPSISPPPPPATGTLVFTGDNGTGISVFAVEDNGTGTRKLSDSTAASDRTVSDVQVSPDQEWVAFIADPTGEDQLYVNQIAGGTPVRVNRIETDGIVTTTVKSFDWSPDSQQLVFAADLDNRTPRGDGTNSFANEIYVIDRNGTSEFKISTPIGTNADTDLRNPQWGPIGPYILHETGPIGASFGPSTSLNLHNAATGNRDSTRVVTTTSELRDVRWAPDGERFAMLGSFLTFDPGPVLATYRVNFLRADFVSFRSSVYNTYAINPDSASLAFSNAPEWNIGFWSEADPTVVPITAWLGLDLSPLKKIEYAPDGDEVAYLFGGEIFTIPDNSPARDPETKVVSAPSASQAVIDFKWSPDSSQLAFVGDLNTDDVFELFVVNADGTGLIAISDPAGAAQVSESFEWSPDGTQIAFSAGASQATPSAVFIAEADGSGVTRVSDASISDIGEIAYISN